MLRLDTLLALARRLLPPVFGALPTPRGGLAWLPPCLSWLGVECRLDADDTVDLATNIDGAGPGRRVLAASEAALREALPPAWGPTLTVLCAWASAREPALAPLPELWLEVDAGGEARPPIVFLTVVGLAPAAVDAVVAAPALRTLGAAESAIARLVRARRGWHPDVHLHHLASLAPRGAPALRVVASAPLDRLLETLDGLGWVGDAPALLDLLDALGDHGGPITFDLDLDDGPARRLGIEWYLPTSPASDPRWQRVLDVARRHAGGRPDRLTAAAAWPRDPADDARIELQRYLHLKFVIRPDTLPTAKAYLGLAPRLRRS